MKKQVKYITKEEADKIIDEHSGRKIMIMTFDVSLGMSDNGFLINKRACKNMVNDANILVLYISDPVIQLDLLFDIFKTGNKFRIIKSVLVVKKENKKVHVANGKFSTFCSFSHFAKLFVYKFVYTSLNKYKW